MSIYIIFLKHIEPNNFSKTTPLGTQVPPCSVEPNQSCYSTRSAANPEGSRDPILGVLCANMYMYIIYIYNNNDDTSNNNNDTSNNNNNDTSNNNNNYI